MYARNVISLGTLIKYQVPMGDGELVTGDIPFSIGICAYNEAGNIERCIRSVFKQKYQGFKLEKVLVVSSASTDDTDAIVRRLMEEFELLDIYVQEKRNGKNSALNCIMDRNTSEIIVMVNADNELKNEDSVQKILEPFNDPKIGIVGGHPIVLNDKRSLSGFSSNFIWALHHHIALKCPKIGEFIAFRAIEERLPEEYQSDEDFIRSDIEKLGYSAAYAPEAETYIKGPTNISDLVKQRLRCNIGQSYMVKTCQYYNPARDSKVLFEVIFDTLRDLGFHPLNLIASVFVELMCREEAKLRVRFGAEDMNKWEPVASTKKL